MTKKTSESLGDNSFAVLASDSESEDESSEEFASDSVPRDDEPAAIAAPRRAPYPDDHPPSNDEFIPWFESVVKYRLDNYYWEGATGALIPVRRNRPLGRLLVTRGEEVSRAAAENESRVVVRAYCVGNNVGCDDGTDNWVVIVSMPPETRHAPAQSVEVISELNDVGALSRVGTFPTRRQVYVLERDGDAGDGRAEWIGEADRALDLLYGYTTAEKIDGSDVAAGRLRFGTFRLPGGETAALLISGGL